MYEYIKGTIAELTPTYVVIESNQIGFYINISLNTFSALKPNTPALIYTHQVIKEDAHTLFGFNEKSERDIFRMLISVSGVGANTARVILSSLSADEIVHAIATENVHALQKIKGIGAKTAQRMIVDLKDKAVKINISSQISVPGYNRNRDEALSALVTLGFAKLQVEKALDSILKELKDASVEDLIKRALKIL
jgi:Holliday junction DNA helicase RuvA